MTRYRLSRSLRGAFTPAIRRAYTLAEMLIVMTIMLMLVVIAMPAVKRVMEDGNVREASRQLNAYFAMAKARALQTGRPCGIMMICDLPTGITDVTPVLNQIPAWPTKQVTRMYLTEVPPPYSGSTIGAVAKISDPTGSNGQRQFMPITYNAAGAEVFDTIWNSANAGLEGPLLANLIMPGETFLVRFSNKGEWYQCMRGVANNAGGYTNPAVLYFLGGASTFPPGYNDTTTYTTGAKTYQIVRLARRIGNPLELTTGTCIDLAYSGIGPKNSPSETLNYGMYPTSTAGLPNIAGYGLAPLQELIVMFTPGGGVETIQLRTPVFNEVLYPTTTAHFLIGRADKLTASPTQAGSSTSHPTGIAMFDPTVSNLADPNSLWVSVSRATGNVTTSDNLPPPISNANSTSATINAGSATQQQTINPSNAVGQVTYLSYCRQLATNREQIRGQ